MQNELNIVIPSYNRADGLKGADYFTTAKYVIPESQRDAYTRAVGVKRLIVIPDESDGNIARKRNWILRNIERPLLMLDDDVSALGYGEGGKQQLRLTPDQALDVIKQIANLAYQWDCRLFGLNVNEDGRNYQEYKPFSFTSVVLGPFHGHLDHDLLYDERMGSKDDYDMSLQVLQRYKMVLRANKYCYFTEHGDNAGGIVSERTMQKEQQYCEAIMGKWGRSVIKYRIPPQKMGDLLNAQKVNVPIAGV